MKKLISIGVALALLAMAVVPVAVGAQDYTPVAYNSTYSKIPFGILSTGIDLLATILPDVFTGLGVTGMDWVPDVLTNVADWVGGPFAWLTELTGWSMVAVGDVMAKASDVLALFGFTMDISGVATLFYTVANRVFDNNNIPTSEMTTELPPALGLL